MRIHLLAASMLAALFVTGCKGDETDETDDTNVVDCPTATPFPANAAADVYYRTSIEMKLQTAAPEATITVVTTDGSTEVAGTSVVNGTTVVFTPTTALAASTGYTATLTRDCGETPWTFTTSAVGTPIGDVSSLEGNAYALALTSGRFVEPAGVGDLLQQFLTTDVLVGVQTASATDIDMIGAIGVDGAEPPAQDTCTVTIPFPTADFSENPFFEVNATGQATNISVSGITVAIDDLIISGAFSPDGANIQGAVLSGSIDTYGLAGILDETCTPDSADWETCKNGICDLAGGIGVTCEACEDGEAHCLSIYVDSIAAEGLDDSLIALPAQSDVCERSECAAEEDCLAD